MKENCTFCDFFFSYAILEDLVYLLKIIDGRSVVKNCCKSHREAANHNYWVKGCSKGFSSSERFRNKKILYIKQVNLVNLPSQKHPK